MRFGDERNRDLSVEAVKCIDRLDGHNRYPAYGASDGAV